MIDKFTSNTTAEVRIPHRLRAKDTRKKARKTSPRTWVDARRDLFSLDPAFNLRQIEERVRRYWEKIDVKKIVTGARLGRRPVGYVEGPPTMNGEPHIGHIRGRVYKDLWYRYSTLRGENIVFRAGWDTQGLPLELEAERELGLTGSKSDNIKAVGEEKLVEACKRLVAKYNAAWLEADRLLGMSIDHARAYWTYRNEYIEKEWVFLERAWRDGILGEGYRVVAYCPSCQTSLSNMEVGLGYETVEDPSMFFKMKLKDQDAFLILWTTMPFTVITDQLVGVKPSAEYASVKVGSEVWIVGKERLEDLMKELGIQDYVVKKVDKGKELAGLRYEHPLGDIIPEQAAMDREGTAHVVAAEEFVDTSTGSGLVHMSPANGQEDFEAARRNGIKVYSPIDDQARFTKEAGVFEGLFVRDADQKVAEALRERDMLLKHSSISHEYPLCWRSHHKLVWLARREYFYWVDRLGDRAIKAAEKVQYFFEPPRNRFLEIIRERVPWCISRERVWGTPLPIWVCETCGSKIPVFSRDQILKLAVELPDGRDFELHRPWIDRIVLRCPKCSGNARREAFVLDTWHNSGAAAYASFTDEEFRSLVPVAFLTEAMDQTRGWAYSLLIENVILRGEPEPPYRAFLFQGFVLDENGNKMSKSLGNVVEGLEVLRKYSVDLIRLYLTWKAPPIDNLNFSFKEVNARPYQILSTLYHMHVYLSQNGEYDGFNPNHHTLAWCLKKGALKSQEYWLLTKLRTLVKEVSAQYQECRYNEAARSIEAFLIEDLSQTYVPMTRSEIWDDDPRTLDRRLTIYAILGESLRTLDKLLHPICPFITEYLYQAILKPGKETLLVEGWPKPPQILSKPAEMSRVDLVLKLVSLSNSMRMKAGLKRRWPLRQVKFVLAESDRRRISSLKGLLKDLANVKKVSLETHVNPSEHRVKVTPNYGVLGPKMKQDMELFQEWLADQDGARLYERLRQRSNIAFKVNGRSISVNRSELVFEFTARGTGIASEKDGLLGLLDTVRDDELVCEGIMRDVARRIQSLRKEEALNPTEILKVAYVTGLDKKTAKLMQPNLNRLAFLIRAKKVMILPKAEKGLKWREVDIDGMIVKVAITK